MRARRQAHPRARHLALGSLLTLAAAAAFARDARGDARSPDSSLASAPRRYPDRTLALIGIGPSIVHADLPDPNRPGKKFGTKIRAAFALGLEVRSWLELEGDLGFGLLGESDSLGAVLRDRHIDGAASFTLVQAGLGVRARWILGTGRWAPFVRAGGGVVSLTLTAPQGLGYRHTDPAWNLGGGVEFYMNSWLALRGEGQVVTQAADAGSRHHAVLSLTLLYALSHNAIERP